MKILRTILILLFSFVIIAGIAGLIILTKVKKSALPQYEGELVLQGLTDEVTVYRDNRGMPHIYAENEHDLYFAVGYIMAQERLWQMDLIRRVTTGQLSEILGNDYVQTDLFMRSLQMTSKSKMVLSNEDPVIIEALQSYTDGVNSFMTGAGRKLPPEFKILSYRPEPWKLEDITNIIGYMGWDLGSQNLTSDIFYYQLVRKYGENASFLIPDWKSANSVVFPDFQISSDLLKDASAFISSMDNLKPLGIASFAGSNNWAVSGDRTETGKPILSNDMHLGFGSPGIWFQMHQVVPGKLNVTGVAVPGQPFIVAGHNEKIAWGLTNLMVDDIDLFAEKINPGNSKQYFFNGEWRDMMIKDEIIKIKGSGQDTFQLKFTHRGPGVSDFRSVKDAFLTMRWSGYDNSDEIKTVYKLNRASGWEEFREALKSFRSISQNFVYADADGNIGMNTGGGVPVRKGHGTIIRNGETDEFDWKGYVPFEQLPYSFNPETGYVSSANNKTVSDSYPYYISAGFALPYRIDRIRQMLDSKEVFTMEDFKEMITDQHSAYAALLVPHILKLNERNDELTPAEREALSEFRGWDYNMNEELVAPALFEFFRASFAENLLSDDLQELYNNLFKVARDHFIFRLLTTGADDWVDDLRTTEKETLDDIVMKSFKDCVATLTVRYGEDRSQWKWGNSHTFVIEHPLGTVKILDRLFNLNSDEYAVGGSDHTVSPYTYSGEYNNIVAGASERHIFNTADWDESFTVIPTGASGVPASEFYLSQTKAYVNREFYKDAFSEKAVKAAAKYVMKLKPS